MTVGSHKHKNISIYHSEHAYINNNRMILQAAEDVQPNLHLKWLSYLKWVVLKNSHTISLKLPIYQRKNYLSQIISNCHSTCTVFEVTIHRKSSPPFADTALYAYVQYNEKWNRQPKLLTLLFQTKLTFYFTSHLCIAGNFKPPSVHYVFGTMKQISMCISKFSKWYWAAGSKPENSW